MAVTLGNKSTGKRAEAEALDIIAGADACRLIQAGQTFVADIKALVPNENSTVTSLLADDGASTEVSGAGTDELNVAGATLSTGAYIIPNKYLNGRSFTSATVGTGSVWAYYTNPINRSNA